MVGADRHGLETPTPVRWLAIALVVIEYRRRLVYLVGISFTAVQIISWYAVNRPAGLEDLSPVEAIDKVAQVLLTLALVSLFVASDDTTADRNRWRKRLTFAAPLGERIQTLIRPSFFGSPNRHPPLQPFGHGLTRAYPAVYTREGGDRHTRGRSVKTFTQNTDATAGNSPKGERLRNRFPNSRLWVSEHPTDSSR